MFVAGVAGGGWEGEGGGREYCNVKTCGAAQPSPALRQMIDPNNIRYEELTFSIQIIYGSFLLIDCSYCSFSFKC